MLKFSPSTKSATADKFIITKKYKKQCWMLRSCDKTKTVKRTSMNYPYFAKIFIFFVVKLKVSIKSSAEWLFASGYD